MSLNTVLIANRGEIACRVIRTANKMGITTIAVYTMADAGARHVRIADKAVKLIGDGYLDIDQIIAICKDNKVDAVHPGYGFLSENASFAEACTKAGIAFLGPSPDTITSFGLKHEAIVLAKKADVPVVPGTGLLKTLEEAQTAAEQIGWPVMLKSTAGGGGIGLQICNNAAELDSKYQNIRTKSGALFKNDAVFMEKYFANSRHIEVQIFGNGSEVIHFGERECSVQRRHQKVIEETPSPFVLEHPELRAKLTAAAVRLGSSIKYSSAGTVEFLVDNDTGNFFFLEVNSRLQVEHPVTECVYPGLDLVELMILQGAAERSGKAGTDLSKWKAVSDKGPQGHSIEVRIYAENPSKDFRPSPGLLQHVEWTQGGGIRIDDWIETGTEIPSQYDPLLAKAVVHAQTRPAAVKLMEKVLHESKVLGPPNNMAYLAAIISSDTFAKGQCLTSFLNTFEYTAHAFEVINPGTNTTVQDYPGRVIGAGIPRGGAMDFMSHCIANALVGNLRTTETLEVTFSGPTLLFLSPALVAVAGAEVPISINGKEQALSWSSFRVNKGDKLAVGSAIKCTGLRTYIAIRGGLPSVATYLGSKSTSAGMGGLQARALVAGDFIDIVPDIASASTRQLASSMRPKFGHEWTVGVLRGPYDDDEFLTPKGREVLYSHPWGVSPSSNRMGIRLVGPILEYARSSGGQGGSHPTNIHDWGYPVAALNLNGDTPVILTCDGPGCGGFICPLTIASSEVWKTGQLKPGDTVRFQPVSQDGAIKLKESFESYLNAVENGADVPSPSAELSVSSKDVSENIIRVLDETDKRPKVTYRQGGDEFVLVEYGPLLLDFAFIARLRALQDEVSKMSEVLYYSPCIRSMLIHFDAKKLSQRKLLERLVQIEDSLPPSNKLRLPARQLHLPLVFDDKWCREAVQRYSESIRNKATYVPSNVEYIAKNNGLSVQEASHALTETKWICVAANFYSGAPFLIPTDPRYRLVASKYNPTRTMTPEGAIGIGGMAACIYPYVSPGGYQLYGRTLPMWKPYENLDEKAEKEGKRPWLMRNFDLIKFHVVEDAEFERTLEAFKSGLYKLDIRQTVFDMQEHSAFEQQHAAEGKAFVEKQQKAMAEMEALDKKLTSEWKTERKQALEEEAKRAGSGGGAGEAEGEPITAPMTANVWKILAKAGDIIQDDTVITILEAMKTEVPVTGDGYAGKKIVSIVAKPGQAIQAGETIAIVA